MGVHRRDKVVRTLFHFVVVGLLIAGVAVHDVPVVAGVDVHVLDVVVVDDAGDVLVRCLIGEM